jgi:hypothetical protein
MYYKKAKKLTDEFFTTWSNNEVQLYLQKANYYLSLFDVNELSRPDLIDIRYRYDEIKYLIDAQLQKEYYYHPQMGLKSKTLADFEN